MTGRRNRAGWRLAAATLLAALPSSAQESAPAPGAAAASAPTWYAQAMAYGDAGLNVTHFWSKGAKLRAETVIAGHKIVTIVSGDTYYAFDGLEGRGVAIRRTSAARVADADGRRPFGRELESLLQQGAEKVGEEVFRGNRAEVYRVTDVRGRREVWVGPGDARLPVRAVVFQRATSRTQTTDYLNWRSNLAIDDRFFAPPPGVELERLSFRQYLERSANEGPVGTVPVLYADLLHGNRRELE